MVRKIRERRRFEYKSWNRVAKELVKKKESKMRVDREFGRKPSEKFNDGNL